MAAPTFMSERGPVLGTVRNKDDFLEPYVRTDFTLMDENARLYKTHWVDGFSESEDITDALQSIPGKLWGG
ncbi:hypothetical protein TNCV_4472911 [Trichonephila clavipes]|uniref:Uncharacterized protein n=1 Tax=Trichonephila clavipes TaxID=2585209 RepID=A0A8X6SH17_TRICX|nr:hypothetical protein TNCV_4472911 [Trichonephila clavipes]